jgi:hypothetical protein
MIERGMMRKSIPIMVALLTMMAVSSAVNAESQYRSTGAPVLEPPPAPRWDGGAAAFEATRRQFAATYVAAGSPRIALFWNMSLSEDVVDHKVSRTSVQGGTTRSSNSLEKKTAGEAGSATLRDGDEKSTTNTTTTSGEMVTNKDKRNAPLAESDAWKLETAFATAMRTANVHFIDRSTIIRMTHAQQGKDATSDSHTIEAKALLGRADMFMEVLMAKDNEAPLGWGFRVSLTDINTGTQLASFYSTAVPNLGPAPKPYFVATNKGFEKVTPQQVSATVEDIGHALARDAMLDLQGSLPAKQARATGKVKQ